MIRFFFQSESTGSFSITVYVAGTYLKQLANALLMSIHNRYFCRGVRKNHLSEY